MRECVRTCVGAITTTTSTIICFMMTALLAMQVPIPGELLPRQIRRGEVLLLLLPPPPPRLAIVVVGSSGGPTASFSFPSSSFLPFAIVFVVVVVVVVVAAAVEVKPWTHTHTHTVHYNK